MAMHLRAPRLFPRKLTTTALNGLTLHETLYGDLARRNWIKNVLIAALVGIVGYAVVALSLYAARTRYVPYILVQKVLERADGMTVEGGYSVLSTPDPAWNPTNAMAEADIRELITTLRGILMDPTENTRKWQRVLARCTPKSGKAHCEKGYWDLKDSQKGFPGKIQVEIHSVLTRQPVQTYEATWTERRYDDNNDLVRTPEGVTKWRGIFTVRFEPTLAHPQIAPDGIFFDAWTITEEK